MPVVVHVGDIGTKKSIELAEHAYRAGADAISSVPPFYWKFRAGDIYNYYRDISESTPLPMVVYNIQLAGLMDMDLLLQLAGLPNVHGLKYTARSHDEMGFIKETLGPDFMIYSGCDEMAFSGMCSGADGIIGSFYNLFPDLYKQILKKVEESDIRGGMRLQRIADEVIFAALKYDFPSVLHNLMNWRGLESGYSRRPFYNYQDSELEGLKEDIRRIKDRYQAEELDMFRL
ncbi:MAG: dihydrodipicolinate synthase family protein [Enterocloster sp.]